MALFWNYFWNIQICQQKFPPNVEEPNEAKQLVWRILISWFILYMVLEIQITLHLTEPDFFRKTSFSPNTGEMDQNWTENRGFLNLFKKLVFNFCWVCSIIKIYIICSAFVHNLCLVKILFLRYGPKCSLPIRLHYF